MGKKVKKKGPNPRKALQRAPAGSRRPADPKPDSEDEAERAGEACHHYGRSVAELNQILLKIRSNSLDFASCEHCRDEPAQGRGSKHGKKKGGSRVSEAKKGSSFVWVCLDCNRYFCGGEVSASEPYGHARRHSKQEKHPWAARSDDPTISWCYACNLKVPIEMPAEEARDDPKPAPGSTSGYVVIGLSNLGNTCFFNSVMQNLLATDVLRDCLLSLERPFGAITMALKKIFAETSSLADTKGVMTPKALFCLICAKQPQFRGYQQQDSHELLHFLLAGLDVEETNYRKSCNSPDNQEKVDPKPGVSFVDAIFGGEISSTVCCMECGFTSVVHEPFLDLSLPVPSKKPTSNKKAPPLPPKRSKAPLRERNKGGKYREKVIAKDSSSSGCDKVGSSGVKDSSTSEHGKEESSDLRLDCSVPKVPDPEQVEAFSMKAEDFTWMDFLHDPYSTSCLDAPVDTEQIPHSESTPQCTSDSQPNERSEDLGVSLESCGDLVPMSCSEDSSAHLLPLKQSNPTIEGIDCTASCSQTPEIADFVDAPVEEEFDGFGDMFNEPEVTSVPKKEDAVGEETESTLWTGNSSESNQDEVDDTNSPVSIDSCLALFTKPELLTGEQAWHCERCSENVEPKTGKPKTAATLDEEKLRRKRSAQNLEADPSSIEVLDNMLTSTSNYLVSEEERLDDLSTIENTSQKSLDIAASSANNSDIQNVVELDSIPQSKSCSSALGNSIIEESSVDQDSGFCITNGNNVGGCDGESEPTSSSAHENDCKSEGKQPEKKNLQLLEKGHAVARNRGEKVKSGTSKVKRDATKRILIYRTPPILTIHLKRFSQDARGRLSKLSGHVGFSEALDLRPYMDPRCNEKDRCQYRLIGVVEHSGSMSGGHYIAYVRARAQKSSSSSQSWFYASDAHIRESSLSEVLSSDAYILFYERVPV